MSTARIGEYTRPNRVTVEEYLRLERAAQTRSELIHGEIVALPGASVAHNRIVTNIMTKVAQQLEHRPCDVFSSDMRVHVLKDEMFFYPDVVALCGDLELLDAHNDSLLNPNLLIEVLSHSTQGYDRSAKLRYYRNIPSLREHWMVDQYSMYIEQMVRQSDGRWSFNEYSEAEQMIEAPSIDIRLLLREIYRRVEFTEQENKNITKKES